jgi:hypothetical protein
MDEPSIIEGFTIIKTGRNWMVIEQQLWFSHRLTLYD